MSINKLPMLNKETSLFWVGWAHFPDNADAANGGVYKKAVLKNLAIFTGKQLCWNFDLQAWNFIKTRL